MEVVASVCCFLIRRRDFNQGTSHVPRPTSWRMLVDEKKSEVNVPNRTASKAQHVVGCWSPRCICFRHQRLRLVLSLPLRAVASGRAGCHYHTNSMSTTSWTQAISAQACMSLRLCTSSTPRLSAVTPDFLAPRRGGRDDRLLRKSFQLYFQRAGSR